MKRLAFFSLTFLTIFTSASSFACGPYGGTYSDRVFPKMNQIHQDQLFLFSTASYGSKIKASDGVFHLKLVDEQTKEEINLIRNRAFDSKSGKGFYKTKYTAYIPAKTLVEGRKYKLVQAKINSNNHLYLSKRDVFEVKNVISESRQVSLNAFDKDKSYMHFKSGKGNSNLIKIEVNGEVEYRVLSGNEEDVDFTVYLPKTEDKQHQVLVTSFTDEGVALGTKVFTAQSKS